MNDEAIEDQDGEVFHFSSRNQRVSETVIQAVSWVEGVEPTDLDPLAEFIDPAALDVIFAKTDQGMLTFDFNNLRVRVTADGKVQVSRSDE